MFFAKLLLCTVLVVTCNARYLLCDDNLYFWIPEKEIENLQPATPTATRVRRDTQRSITINSDGTSSSFIRVPFQVDDNNQLSAIGTANFDKKKLSSATAGLALDNVNGYGLSLTRTKIPDFGKQDAIAGYANLFKNDNHKVDVNAFAARTSPDNLKLQKFNTYGGGVNYMYKDKFGANVGVAHTPFLQKTDYSADAKYNLFHKNSNSIDFNFGASKSVSPYYKSSWIPKFGLSFTKRF